MKKLFLFLLVSMFFISFVSANSCVEPGYPYCWENSNSYGEALARARIAWRFEDDRGTLNNLDYAVGNLYVKSSVLSAVYGFINKPTWDSIWNVNNCDSSGCSIKGEDIDIFLMGEKVKLASSGQSFTDCLAVMSVAFDNAPNGDWAYAMAGYGWIGNGNCVNIKVVECYDNSDCSLGQICDNTGDWSMWSCKTDLCKYVTCEDSCDGNVRIYDGYCDSDTGECVYEETYCDYGCANGKCKQDLCNGVDCNDYCSDSVFYHTGECNPSTGKCEYSEQKCTYGCEGDKCATDLCIGITCDDYCSDDGKNTFYYNGECLGGKCFYDEKPYAEECGEISGSGNIWIGVGVGIFIILVIFIIRYWRRR